MGDLYPSPLEMGRGHAVPHGHRVCVSQRGMRPAGAVRQSLKKTPVGVLDVRENTAARPLSAGAVEFSPALGPRTRVTAGTVDLSSRTGTIAPDVVAEISVPAVAGVRFSAVAEQLWADGRSTLQLHQQRLAPEQILDDFSGVAAGQ